MSERPLLKIAVPNKGALAEPAAAMLRAAGYRQRTDSKDLTLIDTAGYEDVTDESLEARMREQTEAAIEDAEADVCPACIADGTDWVALRRCLECGHVGCCDSSPGCHATAHFRDSHHPVMQSAEPGEAWRWCYVHHTTG